VHPAVKVARIMGASRHSRLETEPSLDTAAVLRALERKDWSQEMEIAPTVTRVLKALHFLFL